MEKGQKAAQNQYFYTLTASQRAIKRPVLFSQTPQVIPTAYSLGSEELTLQKLGLVTSVIPRLLVLSYLWLLSFASGWVLHLLCFCPLYPPSSMTCLFMPYAGLPMPLSIACALHSFTPLLPCPLDYSMCSGFPGCLVVLLLPPLLPVTLLVWIISSRPPLPSSTSPCCGCMSLPIDPWWTLASFTIKPLVSEKNNLAHCLTCHGLLLHCTKTETVIKIMIPT